jgi:hypothetical protein
MAHTNELRCPRCGQDGVIHRYDCTTLPEIEQGDDSDGPWSSSETPASPADPIDQPQDGVGSEEDLAPLSLSWPEFQHLLEHAAGDLTVDSPNGNDLLLPAAPGNEWARAAVLKLREEASRGA